MATKRLSIIQDYSRLRVEQDDLHHVLVIACARHESGVLNRDDRNRIDGDSDDGDVGYWSRESCDECGNTVNFCGLCDSPTGNNNAVCNYCTAHLAHRM